MMMFPYSETVSEAFLITSIHVYICLKSWSDLHSSYNYKQTQSIWTSNTKPLILAVVHTEITVQTFTVLTVKNKKKKHTQNKTKQNLNKTCEPLGEWH